MPSSLFSCDKLILAGQIEYKGKGYFSGKVHTVKALVSPPGTSSTKHTVDGQWHTTTYLKHGGPAFTDVSGPKEEVLVGPLEGQNELESRNLWNKVAKGIKEGDYDTASKEKTKIEVRHPVIIWLSGTLILRTE